MFIEPHSGNNKTGWIEVICGSMFSGKTEELIKDLKKAISINDRYQYITNLFSGDEAMYDRSIKTINNFNIISEAEYWIRRELAVKHGWRDNDPLVKAFYHLVSRRFS